MHRFVWCLVLLFAAALVVAKPVKKDEEEIICGYKACKATSDHELNVHLIAHSHDDVGWLKTVDQYYYGSRTNIQRAGVRYIIDSVIHALQDNPERRFIQVETLFFKQWYDEQSQAKKDAIRKLIENGQFEFTGGAYSMNDEGATHYHSIIQNFDLGLRFLNQTYGECGRPKVGWQIDPFGHSNEMANIFNEMGFDALFFSRLDYRDKIKRLETKTPDLLWQGSHSRGDDSNIFTSIMYNDYRPPAGFCFDILCQDEPIIDRGVEKNIEAKVEAFAQFASKEADQYPTNNIMITMGEDFHYQDASSNFVNMDKLIQGFKDYPQIHNGKKMNVFYSTPTCYVKSVNDVAKSKKQAFALKTDDFFPYATDAHSYWTGYFSSRPTSKRYERQSNNLLQLAKQLNTQSKEDNNPLELEIAVGIMQHHDAATGTEKQHVADDYSRIMHTAVDEALHGAIAKGLTNGLKKNSNEIVDLKIDHCLLANISVCSQSQNDKFSVAIYNPLSHPVDQVVRLPVDDLDYEIKGPNNEIIQYQISPVIVNFTNLGESHYAKYELAFIAEGIPALGANVYLVSKKASTEHNYILKEDTSDNRYNLGDQKRGLTISDKTGLLESVTMNGHTVQITQELMYYIGHVGDNKEGNRASGAYVFRPSATDREAHRFTDDKIATKTYRGDLYDEVHQEFSSWATQVIRVYKKKEYVEFDWLVGPIPVGDDKGKEIITRLSTEVDSDDVFYTDSNGKDMVKRVRNHRDTYTYTNEEPVTGNYYPVTTKITIQDKRVRLSLMNDRAQGGSSLKSGQIEVMLHRRLLHDDAFGVGEALDEVQFGKGILVRGNHYLTLVGDGFSNIQTEKQTGLEKGILAPWTFITDIKQEVLQEKINLNFSVINAGIIPENVQILTVDKSETHKDAILLRLEHIYEKNEHSELSKEAVVDISNLFKHFEINSLRETTLDGSMWLDEVDKLDWIQGGNLKDVDYRVAQEFGGEPSQPVSRVQETNDLKITLKATEIRTFVLFCTYL